jgi:hypothetical protein
MKKLFRFKGLLWQMALIIMLTNVRIASGQDMKVQISPIPDNINKIFQTSCMQCHGINGGMMPLAKLNFSKWSEYSDVKKAEKASKICSVLNNELMPPKSIRKSKPELIPTKEQIGLICKWAETLKIKEGEK